MLHTTRGIVLRSVKYGDSSLICTIFTELYGVQSYIVQGVRSAKAKTQKAGLLQVSTMLEMSVYHNPQKNLQRIKEFHPAHAYRSMHEDVIKNSIALFSAELLLKLLPENAVMNELFEFSMNYLAELDELQAHEVANFPLWFTIQCGRILGYSLHGNYSTGTPHANLKEGAYTESAPGGNFHLNDDESKAMSELLQIKTAEGLKGLRMNAEMRYRMLDWYIAFLQEHTQHMGNIRSLSVLRSILH